MIWWIVALIAIAGATALSIVAAAMRRPAIALPAVVVLAGVVALRTMGIIGAILVGQPAAIAIIVAVKGLGRFTELDSAAARERFIVGTLGSLIWAAACATAITRGW